MNRKIVYKLIDEEREYQDDLGDDRTDGHTHSVTDELILMQVYLQRALAEWANNPGDLYALVQVKKVAAIAVRCLENNMPDHMFEEMT